MKQALKNAIILCAFAAAAFSASAQVQQGITKARGRLDASGNLITGERLNGVIIETDRGKVQSSGNGEFSLKVPEGKFTLKSVRLNEYELNDAEQLKKHSYSPNPLTIVLVKPEEYQSDKMNASRKLVKTLRKTLREREQEISELYKQQKISQKERSDMMQKLYEDEQKNQNLVEKMAERYARTDFDQLDEFRRQVTQYIIDGELAKADSMLNSKGSLEERKKEIERRRKINEEREKEMQKEQLEFEHSKAYLASNIEEFARDCYDKYDIFTSQNQNDSAAYYLKQRADIDSTNVAWQVDFATFSEENTQNFKLALEYYERALRNCDENEQTGAINFRIAALRRKIAEE